MMLYQPLRDRCNILLRVSTERKPSSTKSKLGPELTSSAGHTPPKSSQSRSRITAVPPPIPRLSPFALEELPDVENGPRQLIPYLYLFSPPSGQNTLPAGTWTHVIRILPTSPSRRAGTSRVTEVPSTNGSTHVLDLFRDPRQGSSALPLCKRHLFVARDFLALALPYYASAHPDEDESCDIADPDADALGPPPPSQKCRTDAVRVLLMGPPRALLAMAVTYIAHASGCTVAHVMQCVVDEAEDEESCALLRPDARMGLGSDDMKVLEWLANARV
ncbi:hypothetical protein C8R43DRAFT_1107055 [Mycena crocata]|nr:hypothetical protein C8R43DRAFT_1107055 [Mycena crocata]